MFQYLAYTCTVYMQYKIREIGMGLSFSMFGNRHVAPPGSWFGIVPSTDYVSLTNALEKKNNLLNVIALDINHTMCKI